jgi:hypothetical protein
MRCGGRRGMRFHATRISFHGVPIVLKWVAQYGPLQGEW